MANLTSPIWRGSYPQSAGEYYSSGSYHGSWDVAMPSGTELLAPFRVKVLDANTGVANVPGGSGSPSNWITLGWEDDKRGKVSLYLQHLKDAKAGLVGEWIPGGQLVGHSGNSGNSSGPHLHLTFQKGYRYEWDRYAYLDHNDAIYPPSKAWEDEDMPLTDDDVERIAKKVWNMAIPESSDQKADEKPAKVYLRQAWARAGKAAEQEK